jgi:hypothetical protein
VFIRFCIALHCTALHYSVIEEKVDLEVPGYGKKMSWVIALPLRRCTVILLLLAICSSGLLKGVVVDAFTAPPTTENVKSPRCFQNKALSSSFSTIENDDDSSSSAYLVSTDECGRLDHGSDQQQAIMRNPSRQSQTQAASQSSRKQQEELFVVDRRTALVATATLMLPFVTVIAPSPALALKPKNEALCGTGFFEHIYEYKCTAIGDIEDEGTSRAMSKDENGLTDSLMGKLGFDNSEDAFQQQQQSTTTEKSETKPKKEKNLSGAKMT